MYCPECELHVQTDPSRKDEWTERDEYYYGDIECNGEYDPEQAGEVIVKSGKEWTIKVRIDHCYNCGYTLHMRTYLA